MSALVCVGVLVGVVLLIWLAMVVTDLALTSGNDEEEL